MSVIIIRKTGADKISDKIFNNLLMNNQDGWGIAWTINKKVNYQRDSNMNTFIEKFRQRESQDLELIVHLNDISSGSKILNNIQPFYIKDVGKLFIDGEFLALPTGINEFFGENSLKSDEYIIAELFSSYCHDNTLYDHFKEDGKEMTILEKWNLFLEEINYLLIEETKMVLLLEDGTILNSNPKEGWSKNANKLWFSRDPDCVEKESYLTEPLTIEEVCERLEKWDMTTLDNLINLTKMEVIYLVETYPAQMAEMIKLGWMGVNYNVYDENMIECTDCENVFNEEFMTEIVWGDKPSYVCQPCFKENGA